MMCISGLRECTGCMMCQEPKKVLESDGGEPIYEGDVYYHIGDIILTEEELVNYQRIAEVIT